MKFNKKLLAFRTPKSGIYIAKIGIVNAQKMHKKQWKGAFQMPKKHLSFIKWTPAWHSRGLLFKFWRISFVSGQKLKMWNHEGKKSQGKVHRIKYFRLVQCFRVTGLFAGQLKILSNKTVIKYCCAKATLTSKRELCMPFAGQNKIFDAKTTFSITNGKNKGFQGNSLFAGQYRLWRIYRCYLLIWRINKLLLSHDLYSSANHIPLVHSAGHPLKPGGT